MNTYVIQLVRKAGVILLKFQYQIWNINSNVFIYLSEKPKMTIECFINYRIYVHDLCILHQLISTCSNYIIDNKCHIKLMYTVYVIV